MKIVLCMLVRNERACLEVMLPIFLEKASQSNLDGVIAVDGSSSDGSPELLKQYGVEILKQSLPGRGGAMIEAMQTIPADAYIFFSPDGNEDPTDLPKFRHALENGADLVIASRMMHGAVNEEDHQFFKLRKMANLAFNWMANVAFGSRNAYISDSINGYRAIRRSLANQLKLDAMDYTIEYQMTIRAMQKKAKIIEFPTHEYPRIAGTTGASSIPTGLRFLKRFWLELTHKN